MLPAEFFPPFVAMCRRLRCDPVDLLSVAANESGCNPAAWNARGRAAGLWQMTPVAAPGMGWDPADTYSFTRLSAVEQLRNWEMYFRPHAGKLVNAAACYVCTYLPAGLSTAGNPDALLCTANGRTEIPIPPGRPPWTVGQVVSWYLGNRGFDTDHDGQIHVRDLTAAIQRATAALGSTWDAYVRAIRDAEAIDVTDHGADAPVYRVDLPDDEPPEAA